MGRVASVNEVEFDAFQTSSDKLLAAPGLK
jgi:hypothetical protein